MIKGYLVQIRQSKDEDEVMAYENGEFTYPVFAMLKSAYESHEELRSQVVFDEYIMYSSRLSSLIDGTFPFYEHIKYFLGGKPDFIGFSCYFWSKDIIINFINYLKIVLPETFIILGGPQVNSLSEAAALMEKCSHIDFIIRGLGELPLAALLKWMLQGQPPLNEIKGLLYRDKNGIHYNHEFYEISSLVELPPYMNTTYIGIRNPDTLFFHYMSIGCINSCAYCSWDALSRQKKILTVSLDRAIQDLTFVFSNYRDAGVSYGDAFLLGGNKKRVKEFFKRVIQLREELGQYRIVLSGNLNYMNTDEEILALCKQALFMPLALGMQAYDERIWVDMGRSLHQLDKLIKFSKMVKKAGFPLIFDLIIGLPTQTRQAFIQSLIRIINELKPDGLNIAHLLLFPGARYYEQKMDERYLIIERDGFLVSTKDMSFNDMVYIHQITWGLRIGYEMHPQAFQVYCKLSRENIEEAFRNISEFVCDIKNYEVSRTYENFYNPDYVDILHKYFVEYLIFRGEKNALIAKALNALIEIAKYDMLGVKAKCLDPLGLFETLLDDNSKNKTINVNKNSIKSFRFKAKHYFLLSSTIDILKALIFSRTNSDEQVIASCLSSTQLELTEKSQHYYLFHGINQAELNQEEYLLLRFAANRQLCYEKGLVKDMVTRESMDSSLNLIERCIKLGVFSING